MSKIQVFSPHPDDMALFVGGTMLKHAAEGDEIQCVLMSRGDQGAFWESSKGEKLGEKREHEECELLENNFSHATHVWLGFYDQKILHTQNSVIRVLKQIEKYNPDMIYLPESQPNLSIYTHADHLTTGLIVEEATQQYHKQSNKKITLRYYHSKKENLGINITPYFDRSQENLKFYQSQRGSKLIPYLLWFAWIKRYFALHNWGKKYHCKYAEAFREKMLYSIEKNDVAKEFEKTETPFAIQEKGCP